VNAQVKRLGVAALVLLGALIVATTYWQTWASAALADRQDNEIQRVAQFAIRRGLIRAADGTVLAANTRRRVAGRTLYFRRYPQNGLAAHVVGYSTEARSQAGLERSENDYLTGANANLNTVLRTALDRLKGTTVKGNSLVVTLNMRAQRLATNLLRGKCGAVAAFDPTTGKVLVLASSPGYNQNLIESEGGYQRILHTRSPCPPRPASPLLNRATDGLFSPGSTFKVVTASAALDTGAFRPSSTFFDPGYCIEYGKRVSNAGNPESPEQFGTVDLTTGLEHSINSVFCNIGKQIGAGTILRYAKRFGFYSVPPLETPVNERAPSGLYDRRGRLFDPDKPQFQVDPGRLAFGQERLLVTPLQMAMVAGGIANGGVVMRPYVVDRIVAPDGGIVTRTKPQELGRAVKPQTAAEVRAMMEGAVQVGTGTAAQIPGVRVAGKTGTAETGVANRYTAWFISFAPAERPKVAIAVVLEDQTGFGGQVSAPIAREVMQAILRGT
jgi:peptidoglycan glycosyltransferase